MTTRYTSTDIEGVWDCKYSPLTDRKLIYTEECTKTHYIAITEEGIEYRFTTTPSTRVRTYINLDPLHLRVPN